MYPKDGADKEASQVTNTVNVSQKEDGMKFDLRFARMRTTTIRSERKALLRRVLQDLATLAAEAETETISHQMTELLLTTLKLYRSDDVKTETI